MLALLLPPCVMAAQLSSQQIEALKQQYLGSSYSVAGRSISNGDSQVDEIAQQQRAVQPLPLGSQTQQDQAAQYPLKAIASEPSAIEASFRARLQPEQIPVTPGIDKDDNDLSTDGGRFVARPTTGRQLGVDGRPIASDITGASHTGLAKPAEYAEVGASKDPSRQYLGEDLGAPESARISDAGVSGKSSQPGMAASRRLDSSLRASWDQFLEESKARTVDSELSQYGYELFAGTPNTFAPAADIPVPPEYVLGPGDELQIQFYGSRDDVMNLVVDRNGIIQLPKVGSLTLVGLNFVQAKALIAEQVRKKMMGVTASVTMGRLRSIRVFVLGDAAHPGSYLISGLSTVTHALFAAGGIGKQGSLRNIQLKRNGKVIRELDLYEFLLRGNSRGDERLLPGDVVFVPPVGEVIAVAGQANRPAIYELRGEKSVQDIMALAGGSLPDADLKHIQIDRLSASGDRRVLDLDATQQVEIQNGDILMMFSAPGTRTDTVGLKGSVKRPGKYGFVPGMKLSSMLGSINDLAPGAFLDYALIQRTDPLLRSVSILRVSLDQLLVKHDSSVDLVLQADDQIYVFSKASIDPLNVVSITGQVVNPGEYPFVSQMRLVDLLFAAGGPIEQSYLKVAELTRYEVINGKRQSRHFEVNLSDAIAGKEDANVALMPHDELLIRTISNWRSAVRIELGGEVMYPGIYPVAEGEHLSDVLRRAGGYTKDAYLRAAVFTRESVKADQQKQLDELAQRTQAEVAAMENNAATLKDDVLRARLQGKIALARRISEQISAAIATGRIVIDLKDIEHLKESQFDLTLRDGDRLYVPKRPDEVLVLGEVYNQTAFIYREGLRSKEYLAMAGGPTRNGDEGHTYIVRANGMLDTVSNGWFGSNSVTMGPGDTIIVPQSIDLYSGVDATLDWSRVLMQVGVSLASYKTIGVFK